ncbi:MAG: hypothetical protein JSV39_02580 [Candidatus Aenigmatarchaeota archaeon]|nr:MAG: hypothetical protein JSV39_02580 [Candidatus Aenigmarchaeota archaeon]
MRGQAQLMEYVLLSFFILLIIVVITLFLTGWQITTTGSEQRKVLYDRAEFLLRAFTNSPYINKNTYKEGSMMEDSKLTSITSEDLEILYGKGWFAEIESLEFRDDCNEETPYPLCGKWSYCKKEGNAITFEIPVNIYRKTTGEIDIGFLRVGLYT